MPKKVSFWISQKLKINGSGQGADTIGSVIAVAGIALALIVMLFTISIVLGFKNQITHKIMGFEGQLWIMPDYNYDNGASSSTLTLPSRLAQLIDSVSSDASTYMKFSQPGILKTDNDFSGAYFTGFDAAHEDTFEKSNIVEGIWPDFSVADNSNSIVLSKNVAKSLNLNLGDKVNACFFVDDAIKARKFEIVGLYDTGFSEYDNTIVYAPISTLRRIANVDTFTGTSIVIEIPDNNRIETTASDLQQLIINDFQSAKLDKLYPVDNVKHTGALYFNWLELLNTNVVVIFILMMCVSGFTLISSMFIIILERIPTIGILRSLGANKRMIRSIFIYMALRLVGWGLLIGNMVGIGLLMIQKVWHILKLDPEMYYLQSVPVEINWLYFFLVNVGIIVVSWFILILPSKVAANISPAVTIRYE